MEALLQDLRYATRTLARSPGLVVVAVLSLALGIGVNATVFSCVNALFLRPYPYRDPEKLMLVWEAQPTRGIDRNSVSYVNFAEWRMGSGVSFDGLAAYYGAASFWEQRLYSGMFAAFAAAALLLAAAGLYGVMSYLVSLRTHEIGVRMALGANRPAVLSLIVGRGVSLAGFGLAIGLVGAFGLTRALANWLFGVGTVDPLSFAGIPLMLVGVAALASYIPARRATGVDPVVVLRSE